MATSPVHFSIFHKTNPPQVTRCTVCCVHFHCPLCPAGMYKPRSKAVVLQHLEVHKKNALQHEDFYITKCHHACRTGKSGHFHCPFCSRTTVKKQDAERHLNICWPLSVVVEEKPQIKTTPSDPIPDKQENASTGYCTKVPESPLPSNPPRRVCRAKQTLFNNVTKKREDYLEWPEYFMAVAFLSAQRSKDPNSQVGACIVNQENKIVGIGYNGMPNGCDDDLLPWSRTADNRLDTKYPYVCHAELNAIMNKNSADVKGCTMYVALFPCNECTKLIIQAGIKEVIYLSDKYHNTDEMIASRRLLNMARIQYKQFKPKRTEIVIDFNSINQPGTLRSVTSENANGHLGAQ
ncbi:deoxycytidylate deaminase isoform X1 [Thalassophryne amazonica]|uniref:deoxycytidylate deaminase isoform X1 n=1 Tax=Thalassophryne amazonica TaxID=390379 RepID=UPI0014724AE1|nr:deoxycytidylate deaminase isoform X1 [Thalassophryne amazonica]